MKTPKWICKICKQPLTRKWNAKRHCDIKHEGLSESIILLSEYLKMTNSIEPIKILNPAVYNNINQISHQEKLSFKGESIISNVQPNWKSIHDENDDFNQKEVLLTNTLDKIAPKYEEIRNLLSHIPESNRRQMLGNIISLAIFDDNPLRFINKKIKDLRKNKLHNLMLEDASFFLGMNIQLTKEYLKIGLKEDSKD